MQTDLIIKNNCTYEVLSDDKTVWVNCDGSAVARFDTQGYEFYSKLGNWFVWDGQPYSWKGWIVFVNEVFYSHGIKIEPKHLPSVIKNSLNVISLEPTDFES